MDTPEDILRRPRMGEGHSVLDIAAEWAAFLQSGVASEEDLAVFKTWLEASAEHKETYRKVAQSWEDIGLVAMTNELAREQTAGESLPGAENAAPTFRLNRRWAIGAGLAASLLLVLAAGLWGLRTPPATEFRYATSVGEIRDVILEDGSIVTLGGSTQLAGRFSEGQRTLELVQGRAYFDVQSDPDRPFLVSAAQTQVQVVGTVFDVEYGPEEVQVSVEHGRVNVRPLGDPADADQVLLNAGTRVRMTLDGQISPSSAFDVDTLSWRNGQLAYVDARLEDVIAEVNRYRDRKIRIIDPDLEDLRVSFSVSADQTDILLAGLEATFPIEVRRHASGVFISKSIPEQ